MWELIRINKRNSVLLMMLMASVLGVLGYLIGEAIAPNGGLWGITGAACLWLVMALVSLSSGDQILLAASRAKPVTHDVHPVLFNVVEEMKIASGLPAMPKIYIINDPAPNAFATGRSPQSASVAVTAGLLTRLNRDELQGVIAHEISHIVHRDILYMTIAGVMLGTIVLLSHVFLRGMYYRAWMGSGRRYSSGGKEGGYAQLIILLVAVIAAILAPIMAYLFYFALSRKREYLADAGAARLTRYPEGLASALEKIASDPSPQLATVNKVTAPMYIANPFKRKKQTNLSNLTSTHPPISERIKILRTLSGASYLDYAKAFTQTTSQKSVVPASALKKEDVPLRSASTEPTPKTTPQQQLRQVGDLMRKVNGFAFLACVCGMKFKIPPDFKGQTLTCPRCQHQLELSVKARPEKQS